MNELKVKMFGDFIISYGDRFITSIGNRSKKVWSLIAFLLYNRRRVVSQKELVDILWSNEDKDINSSGALKTLLYRARAELDCLFEGAGKKLIIYNGDGYSWNDEIPVSVDCETFEDVLSEIETKSIEEITEVMDMFQGDFLESLASEFWIMPITAYYHNLFVNSLRTVVPVMIEKKLFDEALSFCRIACGIEPYNEEIHRFYMEVNISCGNTKKAAEVYQKLSERLISELGVIASEETRNLYHEATKTNNLKTLTVENLKDQLRESSDRPGALICEYDFFKVLYYSMARSIMRNGIAVHIALISVTEKHGELSAKKLEKVMPCVEETVCRSLRRGDSVAKCSISQYVIMLPGANYENSCMVCDRIIKAFNKKYSHCDACLHYSVFPIEPDSKESFQWNRDPSGN